MSNDNTKMFSGYIESNTFDGNERLTIATSINPSTFGEMNIKIQESGQKHKDTVYFEMPE